MKHCVFREASKEVGRGELAEALLSVRCNSGMTERKTVSPLKYQPTKVPVHLVTNVYVVCWSFWLPQRSLSFEKMQFSGNYLKHLDTEILGLHGRLTPCNQWHSTLSQLKMCHRCALQIKPEVSMFAVITSVSLSQMYACRSSFSDVPFPVRIVAGMVTAVCRLWIRVL